MYVLFLKDIELAKKFAMRTNIFPHHRNSRIGDFFMGLIKSIKDFKL
jgi:hypothetical protein